MCTILIDFLPPFKFNLTIAAIDLEQESIDEEAQAAVEAGEDQERRAW